MKKASGKIIILSIFLVPLLIIAFIFVVASNTNNSRIELHENYIEFDALTYDKVLFENVEDVKYFENLNIHGIKKGVGFSNHHYYSGDAQINDVGKCRAYIYYKKDYFVVIKASDVIVFNMKTESETKEIYKEILDKIEKENKDEKQ